MDHLKDVKVMNAREQKKSKRERALANIYKAQPSLVDGSARSTLKANLRKNMKTPSSARNNTFGARHHSMQVTKEQPL